MFASGFLQMFWVTGKITSVISKLVELRTSLGIRTHRYTLLKEGPCPFSASVFPTLGTAEGTQGELAR